MHPSSRDTVRAIVCVVEKPLGLECLQRKTGHEPRVSARAARGPLVEIEQIAKMRITLDIGQDGQRESCE